MAIVGTPSRKSDRSHFLNDGVIEEIEVWQVFTDGSSTLPEIRDASPIPAYWSRHPDDPALYVASKRVRPTSNPEVWHVEVSCSGGLYSQPHPDNPIEREVELEWATVETIENIDTDIHGAPIQNVVGEDFDPPPTALRGYTALTITRNELLSEFSASKAEAFCHHVNKSAFFGAPPHTVLCKSIMAKRIYTNQIRHWRTTYEFLFKLDQGQIHHGYQFPWGLRIANKGKRQPKLTATPGVLQWEAIKDANGDAITEPVCLGLDGFPTSQQVGSIPTFWLGFQIYPEAEFSVLGLEQS